ncbi:MAG: methionine--tRNA ligase [Nitrospinota bacterium]|nr:methionine--tRNA ligase [Nitrospinota bacterium]
MPEKTQVVTAALPYANGSIHIGHLLEYIQVDIYVRFRKMRGVRCLYFCADDTHGAPIMIRARNENTTPEAVIERFHQEHIRDFADFLIEFDNYHSTNSPENKQLAEEVFLKLKDAGAITQREVEQSWCDTDKMFLPDRFVRGACPRCKAEEQYGDACDACGAHYDPTELISPRCSMCGAPPVRKKTRHYFFRVADYLPALEKFMEGDALQQEVKNFLATWLKEGLKEWDISRDGPYFGFKIPGEDDKYFYVWLDAPIGYISSAKNWADKHGENLDDLWRGQKAEIRHFIGKDIKYFHTLFWIPMLTGAGFSIPDKVHVHGFLTVNGEKMSKSKGTFVNARTFLDHMDPETLRYYYASKLKDSEDDLDLSFQDFVFRVNAELVNKVANLGSRTVSILNKNKALENRLGAMSGEGQKLVEEAIAQGDKIAECYDALEFGRALKLVMGIADAANVFIDQAKPWELKNEPERQREVLSAGVNAFRLIALYLKPVIPRFAAKTENMLAIDPMTWDDHKKTLTDHTIGAFERLAERVDMKAAEKIISASLEAVEKTAKAESGAKAPGDTIEYDDFAKVRLVTGKVLEAEKVKKADKLLKLTVEIGGESRVIVAGIAKSYTAEEMPGKIVVVVENLAPRKLKGIESQGMLLAVNDGETLTLVAPEKETPSGIRVS